MFCLQLHRPRQFSQVDIPEPVLPGREYILVRFDCALVCGSDIPYFNGTKPSMTFPLEPGRPIHECTGRVVESSSGHFRVGDRVVAMPEGDCGLCEFFVARADEAVKLPRSIEDPGKACLIQPLATMLAARDRLGRVRGESATIIGGGPIGLMFTWLLARGKARHIRVLDPIGSRCERALELGAAEALPLTSGQAATLLRDGGGRWSRADICVEAVGHQTVTINDALELVKDGGRILALGVPDQPVYAFDFNKWFRKNLQMVASVAPHWPTYLSRAVQLFAQDPAPLSSLITHRFGMHQAADAFGLAELKTDGAVKVLIDGGSRDDKRPALNGTDCS